MTEVELMKALYEVFYAKESWTDEEDKLGSILLFFLDERGWLFRQTQDGFVWIPKIRKIK